MYFLQYEVYPDRDNADFGRIGGAFVNCWINVDSQSDAERIALRFIADDDWILGHLEDFGPVDIERSQYSKEALECIEQARVDSEVYVFHTWPPDVN